MKSYRIPCLQPLCIYHIVEITPCVWFLMKYKIGDLTKSSISCFPFFFLICIFFLVIFHNLIKIFNWLKNNKCFVIYAYLSSLTFVNRIVANDMKTPNTTLWHFHCTKVWGIRVYLDKSIAYHNTPLNHLQVTILLTRYILILMIIQTVV